MLISFSPIYYNFILIQLLYFDYIINMKYSLFVLSLLLAETSGIKINQDLEMGDDEALAPPAKDDIESLMDKYDTAEAEKNKPKPVEKPKDANG